MLFSGFIKLTYIDTGQSPLQLSVHVSDTSVTAKTEISKLNDVILHLRFSASNCNDIPLP